MPESFNTVFPSITEIVPTFRISYLMRLSLCQKVSWSAGGTALFYVTLIVIISVVWDKVNISLIRPRYAP